MSPRDMHIDIKAATSGQYVLNGGPKGATFPGWFITALENEGYQDILMPVQLTVDEVLVIADVIDRTVDKTDRSRWRVTNAVKRTDAAMRNELERQLEAAEKAAARIPDLRRRLGLEEA